MSNDPLSHRERFGFHRAPGSRQARVATLRDMAHFAGEAFGWDEGQDGRLERGARLQAARRAVAWTLAAGVLMMLVFALSF
ncbi:MAG: hypothetical protein JJU21_04945 [Salinarimonas sp.]|nr:hypothetical protein [Salinarimonas sp.]